MGYEMFKRKVRNRIFAIENAGDLNAKATDANAIRMIWNEDNSWERMEASLVQAGESRYIDAYAPIVSNRRFIGGCIVFIKRVLRKMIKIFYGWYVFPIYDRQNIYNGKLLNAICLLREFVSAQRSSLHEQAGRICELERKNSELAKRLAVLEQCNYTATAQKEKTK